MNEQSEQPQEDTPGAPASPEFEENLADDATASRVVAGLETTDGGADENSSVEPQVSLADGVREAFGGVRGMIDSGLPSLVFVIAWLVTGHNLRSSVTWALGAGAVVALLRIIRRQKLQQVVSGFIGVAISAFIADRTHRASNFFLPGIFTNAAYLIALLTSLVLRKPLIGYLAVLFRADFDWRNDPEHLRAALRATWVWVAIFAVKLAVQVPLLRADETTALGIAKIAMGYPLFILGGWITWRMLRRVHD